MYIFTSSSSSISLKKYSFLRLTSPRVMVSGVTLYSFYNKLLLPNCGANVVVKSILDKAANNAGFPHSGILKTENPKSFAVQQKKKTHQGSLLTNDDKNDTNVFNQLRKLDIK